MSRYAAHEQAVGKLALEIGFEHVSLSSEVMPMIRAVPRGFTASADAYLTPLIKKYVQVRLRQNFGFRYFTANFLRNTTGSDSKCLQGFVGGFRNLSESQVLFMKSDGGLTPMNEFCGSRAVLSGPAGGVVGYARTCFDESRTPVIGFDMGGTSTDVSRYDGSFEHTWESVTAGVAIQAPQVCI